ncbi:hypothetical protein KY330_02925 [Candidatus Woesearchaeota archaeon]|nr:hypothetical protein [Candidatus Woesearchaeota archaeon]
MIIDDKIERIAKDLGFVRDKYYLAADYMFRSMKIDAMFDGLRSRCSEIC